MSIQAGIVTDKHWQSVHMSFTATAHKTQIILPFIQTNEFRYFPSEDAFGIPRNAPPRHTMRERP